MKRNCTSEDIVLLPPVSPTKVFFFHFFFSMKFIEWRNNHLLHHYRPQRSCGKVMFLHLSVILFTGGVSQHALGQTQPWAPPRTDTPSTPGQTPPWADTPQAPPQQKTTAADGTREHDYIAFDEYYNEPIGRSFGNCEIPFVTS